MTSWSVGGGRCSQQVRPVSLGAGSEGDQCEAPDEHHDPVHAGTGSVLGGNFSKISCCHTLYFGDSK